MTAPREPAPQRQDSLTDQLTDLQRVAVRLGMYDAADWLWEHLSRETRPRRRFCRCGDQDYCARVSTYGMTEVERAGWLARREEAAAEMRTQ